MGKGKRREKVVVTSGESSGRRGRERGERGGRTEERERWERELSWRRWKKTRKGLLPFFKKNSPANDRSSATKGVGLNYFKRQVVCLTRTTGRPKTWQTTRRFPFIRTTSCSIRTNDTPFDPTRERLCTPRQTTRRLLQTLNDRSFAFPFFFRFYFSIFKPFFT